MPASLTAVARHFLFVRETEGPNRGFWVAYIQRFTGNAEGAAWCASFTSLVLDIAYKGKSPLTQSASTITQLTQAKSKGFVVKKPMVDDLFFYVRGDGTPHHTGVVSSIGPLRGCAGNTSPGGTSSDGDGVHEHGLTAPHGDTIVFVRLPR